MGPRASLRELVANSKTLRALRHRNYRLFISGQTVSLVGTWIQSTAQGWLVYTLTANPFLLGLTNFASQVPVLALAVFGGLVADVFDRHRTVIITQTLLMLQAFALGTLTLWTDASGQPVIQIWHVLLLATLAGADRKSVV